MDRRYHNHIHDDDTHFHGPSVRTWLIIIAIEVAIGGGIFYLWSNC